MCAGSPLDWTTMAAACVGTGLCAGSASTFNQVLEKDRDATMKRTKTRPLPLGKVSQSEAVAFGVSTGVLGTGLLFSATNPLVAALGAANIFLYAGPYTLSKPVSEINTWIGSVVGAIPPVMGWLAAGGALLAPEPAVLGSILFLWQFPHFFALSWMHREDYARGGFQMVAVNDPTGSRSANLIMKYSLYLSAVPLVASATGLTSVMFAVSGSAANAYLLHLANRFRQDKSNANARRIFLCSLWYLPLLLGGFVFFSRNWQQQQQQQIEDEQHLLLQTQQSQSSEGEDEDEDGQQQQQQGMHHHHQKQLQEDHLGATVRKAKEVRNVRPSGSKGKSRK